MVALSVMDRVSTVGLVWLIGDRFLGVVMVYAPMNCGACFIQVPGCDGSNAISGIDADELLVMYWPWAGSSEQWSWGGQCDADHTMCAMLILGSVMLTTLCLQWSWGESDHHKPAIVWKVFRCGSRVFTSPPMWLCHVDICVMPTSAGVALRSLKSSAVFGSCLANAVEP